MKILFAGGIEKSWQSGSQRLLALKQIGQDVEGVSITHAQRESRYLGYFRRFLSAEQYEIFLAPRSREVGKIILEGADRVKPDVIWLEWPKMVSPDTIQELRKRFPKAVILSYHDDNPFGPRRFSGYAWQNFFKAMPYYDLHFVKRYTDVPEYEARGATGIKVFICGYADDLFYPEPTEQTAETAEVVFVGTALDQRVVVLDELTGRLGVDVHIYGDHWEKTPVYKDRQRLLHPFLTEEGYRQVVSNAKMALGFVSHSHLDQYTTRLFEITACGTMFLGEATDMQKELYAPDKEAVYFDSPEECRDKIKYYLCHDEERERIAEAGRIRSKSFGYRNRMIEAVSIITEFRNS